MSDVIGILGIVVAFFIVIYFTYKGFHLAYVAVVASLVVMVTNGLPVLETFSGTVMEGVASQVPTLLPLYLFGAIFGKLFIDSGAAHSLARSIMGVCAKNADGDRKRTIGCMVIIIVNAILNFVGVDPFASLFTMIGIATGIMSEINLPRKFMPVLLVIGSSVGNVLPGSLAVPNILCVNFLGTKSYAGPIPGLFFCVFLFTASTFYLNRLVKKSSAAGEVFEYGPLQPAKVDFDNIPNIVLTLIPLVMIPISYNTFFNSKAWAAMALGCVLAIALFGRYIPKLDGKSRIMTIVESMNNGVTMAGIPAIILLNYVIGYTIEAAPSFEVIVNVFTSLPGPALISLAIMGILLLGAAASASGLIIALGVAASIYIPTLGVTPEAAHRVLICTNTTLDSLPFCGAIVAMMAICDIKYKDGYPPIAITTVGFTILGTFLTTFLILLFPGLA